MGAGLPLMRIYRPASAPPTLPSVAAPAIKTLDQALDQEVTIWARIRAHASERYKRYQEEKKRKEDRAKEVVLIRHQEREGLQAAQVEFEVDPTLEMALPVGDRIIAGWEQEIEEWKQIRAHATERYQKYRLEREKGQEVAGHDEHLRSLRKQQRRESRRSFRMRMVHLWLHDSRPWSATSLSEQSRKWD